jgi:response regulator RpfG family c-di-GMP phosphodiesterase
MKKILFVDDDPNILAAFQRQLRKQFELETALGPEQGLVALNSGDTYAVVVADMTMPGMNGIEFLSKVQQRYPHIIRVMLTGNVDQPTAVRAVNEGNVFRFLTKPCPMDHLARTLALALRQFDLVTAEHVLLEQTLRGVTNVLTDILGSVEPEHFGRAQLVRRQAAAVIKRLQAPHGWEIEMAAMLAKIGMLTLPAELTIKSCAGQTLTKPEQEMLQRVPEIGAKLLANIPRLENVARIVLYHQKRFDGSGFPADELMGAVLPLGARLLKILFDLQEVQAGGIAPLDALIQIRQRSGWYDVDLLQEIHDMLKEGVLETESHDGAVAVPLRELAEGHKLYSNVETRDGVLMIPAGHIITQTLLVRLQNFAKIGGIKEPIYVHAPEATPEPALSHQEALPA